MANSLSKTCDFILKVIMLFTTIMALIFFAGYYTSSALIFGFLALIFVISLIIKGLADIFSKE